jgi:hypothetical protein
MTTYYVVGGGTGGTVDLGSTAAYSLTSGGASAGVFPVNGDDIIVNTASGTNFFVTGNVYTYFKSFTCGVSSTPIFNGVTIYTDPTNLAATSFSLVATCSFNSGSYNQFNFSPPGAAVACTVNFAGVNLRDTATVNFSGNGAGTGTINLAGAIVNAEQILIDPSNGNTFNTANNAMSTTAGLLKYIRISANNGGITNLGASTITSDQIDIVAFSVGGTVNLNTATLIAAYSMYIGNNGTVNANTSTVRMFSNNTVSQFYETSILTVLGTTLNAVQLQGISHQIVNGLVCATLTVTNNAIPYSYVNIPSGGVTTSGAFTVTGNSAVNRILITSDTFGTARAMQAGSVALTNVDFQDITNIGVSSWTGTSLGNAKGNTNITFTTPVTRYAKAAGNWNSTATWSATNGGAAGASVPLAQDTVFFTNLAGAGTYNTSNVRFLCSDLTVQSGFPGTLVNNRYTASTTLANTCTMFGNYTTPSTVSVTSDGASFLTMAARTAVNLSLGNNTTSQNLIVENGTTATITNPLGSASNTANQFDVNVGGTLNTGATSITGNAVYVFALNGPGTINLQNSDVYIYGSFNASAVNGGTSTVYAFNVDTVGSGSPAGVLLYNLYYQATSNSSKNIRATISNIFSTNNITYPTTSTFSLGVTTNIVMQGSTATWSFGANPYVINCVGATFVNNTSTQLQTSYVTYQNCSASGTYSAGSDVAAFGLANFGGNTGIAFPSKLKTYAYSNTTSQSLVMPNDFFGGRVAITAIGAGGTGITGFGGGGGGGYGYSVLNYVNQGQTLYVSSTTPGVAAWGNTSNTTPSSSATGALGNSGGGGGGGGGGGLGLVAYSGGAGGSGTAGGGGGGASATSTSTGFRGGNGGASRQGTGGGGGGGGITGLASNVSDQNGTAGGNPSGGAAGVGGASNTAGGNATVDSGGGGGGAGASYAASGTTTESGLYSRGSASTTLAITDIAGTMISGISYPFTFTPFNSGAYNKAFGLGQPVVHATSTPHGLSTGQIVYLDYTSGPLSGSDTYYTITVTGANTFTYPTSGFVGALSGNVSLLPAPASSSFVVTKLSANDFTITTTSTCVIAITAVSIAVPVITYSNAGLAGGQSSARQDYTYDYLNGVAVSGTIGPGGGGGGGSASYNLAGGNAGTVSGVGAGGGSGGVGATNGTSATGSPGLVLIQYVTPVPPPFGTIVG